MKHWNKNQLVALTFDVTGSNILKDDIYGIAAVALDSHARVDKTKVPLCLPIQPERDFDLKGIEKRRFTNAKTNGIDRWLARDLFIKWVEKLELPYRKYGYSQCQIMPLVYNWGKQMPMLQHWLGDETFVDIFHWHVRDLQSIANFINDNLALGFENVKYSKVDFGYLLSTEKIKYDRSRSLLGDTQALYEWYSKVIARTLL